MRGLNYEQVLNLIRLSPDDIVLDVQDSSVDIERLTQQAQQGASNSNQPDVSSEGQAVHVPTGYRNHRRIALTRHGQLGLNIVTEEAYPRIVSILKDSNAAKTGQFETDDYILQVPPPFP